MRATTTPISISRALRAIPASWRPHALPLGAALLVGAILRLLWLGDTSFLGDQAQLLALGRSAANHRAFIITGIPSSIGALNLPISDWLYAPFALVSGPLGATLFTALANIAAIALLYLLAARYYDRLAAFSAAFLYATASGPVHYARFVWQQNLLAPVILLFIWMIARAVVEGQRGWLGWSVLLWGIATGLHPTAAPLLGLIVVALALAWRVVRRRDVLWAAGAALFLFGPTLLWEAVSHGADLSSARSFTQGHAVVDASALGYLVRLIQPAPPDWFGANSSYFDLGHALTPLGWLMAALLVCAEALLAWRLLAPWLRHGVARLRSATGLREGLREGLAEPRWRLTLILTLWQALPLAFMLRHGRAVEPHYLLVLLPCAYLCVGALASWAREWPLATLARSLSLPPLKRARLGVALAVLTFALSAAQMVGVVGELTTIHGGAFDGLATPLHYGVPLSSQRQALAATQTAARRLGASVAIAATHTQQESLGYLNATDTAAIPATDYISAGCVALPAENATEPLVTLALPGSDAASLLPSVDGARSLGSVAVQGDTPYQLYAIRPGATLRDERPIASSSAKPGVPRPVAYTYTPPPAGGSSSAGPGLAIRWSGAPSLATHADDAVRYWDGADPRGAPIADYTTTLQALDAHGATLGAPIATTCARLAWSSTLSLVTITTVPATLRAPNAVSAWRVTMIVTPAIATRHAIGPLALESGAITFGPPAPLGQVTTFAAPTP